MNSFYAYSFLSGLFIGGYTNFFSKLVISGLVLYIVHPENFTLERFNPLYERICEKTHPIISKFYTIQETETPTPIKTVEEKVSIIPSPLPLNSLPQLTLKVKK